MLVTIMRARWAQACGVGAAPCQAAMEATSGLDTYARQLSEGYEGHYEQAIQKMPPDTEVVFALRQKYLDDFIAKYMYEHRVYEQVVLLGAGLDTTAGRWAPIFTANDSKSPKYVGPGAWQVFEVDLPAMVAQKRTATAALEGYDSRSVVHVPCDFELGMGGQRFTTQLLEAGFNPYKRTIFAAMGLVYYLQPDVVSQLFQEVGSFGPDHALLFDYATPAPGLGAAEAMKMLADMGSPIKFLTSDIIPAMTQLSELLPVEDVSILTLIAQTCGRAAIREEDKRTLRLVTAGTHGELHQPSRSAPITPDLSQVFRKT